MPLAVPTQLPTLPPLLPSYLAQVGTLHTSPVTEKIDSHLDDNRTKGSCRVDLFYLSLPASGVGAVWVGLHCHGGEEVFKSTIPLQIVTLIEHGILCKRGTS